MDNTLKRYDSVNILRIICAYLVMIIHLSPFSSFGQGTVNITNHFICRIAVPFFFVTSGYFLYSKINEEGYIKKYIKKLIVIYVIVSAVYLLIAIPFAIMNNLLNPMFFINGFFINGLSPSLWYFPALIISSAFVSIFFKKDSFKLLFTISILLILLSVMGDSYYGLIENTPFVVIVNIYNIIFDNTRNGLCIAVPFLTIGATIKKYNLNQKIKKPLIILALSILLYACEVYFLIINDIPKDFNIYLSLTLVAPLIFIAALNSKIKISGKISSFIKEISLWLYCFHEFVQVSMYIIISLLPLTSALPNLLFSSSLIQYLIVAIITTLIAFIISKILLNQRNKIPNTSSVSTSENV